jgi:hypothetical protein
MLTRILLFAQEKVFENGHLSIVLPFLSYLLNISTAIHN